MALVGTIGRHMSGLEIIKSRELRRSGVKLKTKLPSRLHVMSGRDERVRERMKVQAGQEDVVMEPTRYSCAYVRCDYKASSCVTSWGGITGW